MLSLNCDKLNKQTKLRILLNPLSPTHNSPPPPQKKMIIPCPALKITENYSRKLDLNNVCLAKSDPAQNYQ